MSCSIDAFNIVASDIGVKPFEGENGASFCRRVAYSAARFWLLAFCMDDGAGGERGLTKQMMNRRLRRWVSALDRIHPGMSEWFDAEGKGIQAIYNRLIDIGDLVPNGFSDFYIATAPAKLGLSGDFSCVTGYYDPTVEHVHSANSLLLSGLASLMQSTNERVLRPDSWWIRDFDYIGWEEASNFEEVKFADVRAPRWNIKRSDAWTDAPFWVDNLALARVDGNGVAPVVFAAIRVHSGRVRLSRVTWIQAQELFFYLRCKSGNEVVARYEILDDLHVRAKLPIGFVPGHINRILDAVGWPVDNAVDRFNRIVRVEALPLVEELLSASYIRFERA